MRRMKKVRFNQKLVTDVVISSLIVQKVPDLLLNWLPFSEQVKPAVGGAAGYFVGMMFGRPDLANASIGLAVTDFVSPFIDDLMGGIGIVPQTPGMIPGQVPPSSAPVGIAPSVSVEDYINLNDYTNTPDYRQNYYNYQDSY